MLRLDQLLVEFQLEAHVNFDLAFELSTERTDLLLHIESLRVELDKLLPESVSLESCLFKGIVHGIELIPHRLKFIR